MSGYGCACGPRFGDHRAHPCGCWTHFDLGAWQSVTLAACATHAAAAFSSSERP